jgi:GTP-binding protein
VPGKEGIVPLLDAIVSHIPPPNAIKTLNEPFAMSINTIATDSHLGRIVTGKVESGIANVNDKVKVMTRDGQEVSQNLKITKLFYLEGLKRVDVDKAYAGMNIM